jgi:hypothetical protein
VHLIEKGNTNGVLKCYMAFYEEKGKKHEDSLGKIVKIPYYQGDAVGEFVKCKLLKTIRKPKFPGKPDISGFWTSFQRLLSDMFGPQPGHVQASVSCQRLSLGPDISSPLPGSRDDSWI